MSTTFKIIGGVLVLWSTIYAISFSVSEFKNKQTAGGITSLFSVLIMLWAYIKGVGF